MSSDNPELQASAELFNIPKNQPNFADYARERWNDRGEEGFINPLMLMGGAKAAKAGGEAAAGHLGRHKFIYGFMGLGLALSVSTCGAEVSGDANLSEADTVATVNKIVWDKEEAITPATVYFSETLSAEDIHYNIVVKACPPLLPCTPDLFLGPLEPRVNKEIEGPGQETIQIPFDAIQEKASDKKGYVNLEVDVSEVKGQISWSGAGPEVRDYTISGGEKNYGDRSGFRYSMTDFSGALQRVINLDTLANTVDDLDSSVGHDMKVKGLEAFGQCNKEPAFQEQFQSLADEAIRANFAKLGDPRKIDQITFTNTDMGFQIDKGEQADKVTGSTYKSSSYELSGGNFKLDKLNCNVDKQEVVQ